MFEVKASLGFQQLPWENIPILRNQPVTRAPSLQFILSRLPPTSLQATTVTNLQSQQKTSLQLNTFDPASAAFVLNPGNDLARTQAAFEKQVFILFIAILTCYSIVFYCC
jgi:hypothetical protein